MGKRVSEAELEIMEALWSTDEPIGASEVAARIPDHRDWSLPTVKTMLSRLVNKGAARYRAEGRRYLYSAAIERNAYVGGESKRLVDRLFGGKLSPLVAQLAEDDGLSNDDIAEIEAILRELKQ